jgi:hypothetical protein
MVFKFLYSKILMKQDLISFLNTYNALIWSLVGTYVEQKIYSTLQHEKDNDLNHYKVG